MKKNLCTLVISLFLIMSCAQLSALVKVLVNNSQKKLNVRLYGKSYTPIAVNLDPGAIQEVFVESATLDKITITLQHENKNFASMHRQILTKENFALNDHMIFIIQQNGSVKMYQGCTSRDKILQEIDVVFMEHKTLPTLELSIHTTKTDQPWILQQVQYSIRYAQSLLKKIESLFS